MSIRASTNDVVVDTHKGSFCAAMWAIGRRKRVELVIIVDLERQLGRDMLLRQLTQHFG